MPNSPLRQAYVDLLMEQLTSPRYPSVTMLDRIEAAIADRESAEAYVRALIDKMTEGQYPSPTMLDRVNTLIDQLDWVPPDNGEG